MGIIYAGKNDRQAWEEAKGISPSITNMLNNSAKDGHGEAMSNALSDVFQVLYQRNPLWRQTTQPTLHEHVLREIADSREVRELTALTQGDVLTSAMASSEFGSQMYSRFTHGPLADYLEEEWTATNELEKWEKAVEDLEDLEKDGYPVDGTILDDARDKLGRARKKVEGLDPQKGAKQFDDAIDNLRRDIKDQARQTKQDVSNLMEAENMMGKAPSSIEAKLRLKERLFRDGRLKKLIELAGRMRRTALKKRYTETKDFREEVVGVKYGDELDRLVPAEMALLATPETRNVFMQRFADKQLALYDTSGQDREGAGPIIVLIDSTGSMSGKKELWSKAVFMGYMAVAEQENRDLYLIQFGGSGQTWRREFLYGSNPKSVTRALTLEAVDYFMEANSTCLHTPLQAALDILGNPKWKKADVVLITDAEASPFDQGFAEEFNKAKQEKRFSAYAVLINNKRYEETLKVVMDKVITAANLDKDEDITTFLYAS